ncbi:MAG: nitroreductase family protein [Marinicaulis sp.]|nr:nitroreductase family protein [Marinicaulis sp.]NNE41493.1 nitroreductase family protein [Marinicaulis sp.]NNL89791.1 nitroreductase family protein [Marinicaulis sp.]
MFSRDDIQYEAIPLPHRANMTDGEMLKAAKSFFERMKKRHSVRDFSDQPVPREVIEECVRTAGRAPSGANHQPWHFAAISDPEMKHEIRLAAEAEEKEFYAGGASDEWLKALEPIGTDEQKPHLDIAPWLIVVFSQRWGEFDNGVRFKNYYVPESVGIATGFLIAALHHAGLVTLTHTPNPMRFLNGLIGRPESEKPIMIIAVGHPAADATIPQVSTIKKPLDQILSVKE